MTDLEQFLRQASRGLWGHERQTVRRELESHIRQRAQRYEIDGSSEVEAIKLAIADLGEPQEISAGMKGVYTMANTIRVGVFTAALATFVFMGAQLSTAQVTGTYQFPTPDCIEKNQTTYTIVDQEYRCNYGNGEFYVSIQSVQAVLEPLGVTFKKLTDHEIIIRFPEGESVTMPTHLGYWQAADKSNKLHDLPVINGYIYASTFIEKLFGTHLRARIEGWDNPKITVGKTSFRLGTDSQIVSAGSAYGGLISRMLRNTVPDFGTWPNFGTDVKLVEPSQSFTHKIRVDLKPGSIAVVLSDDRAMTIAYQKTRQTLPAIKRAFVALVGTDGTISYTSFSRTLAVVNQEQISRGVANGHATIAVFQYLGNDTLNALQPVAPESIKIQSR
jgi:hypothetical protein